MIAPTDPEAIKHALRRAYAAHDHLANRHALAVVAIEHSARQAVLVTEPDDLAGFVAGLPDAAGHEVVLLAVYRDAFTAVIAELTAALPAALGIGARATAADELVARIQAETKERVRLHNASLCPSGD